MVTIEENGLTATAETYLKAKRQLAKLVAAQEAEAAARRANADIAQLKAESNAFLVLSRKIKGEAFPRGWHLSDDDSPVNCFKVLSSDGIAECEFQSFDPGWVHSGRLDIYPSDFLHGIVTCGKGVLGAFIAWGGQPMEFCAIGVHNGELRWVTVPGVTAADFSANN